MIFNNFASVPSNALCRPNSFNGLHNGYHFVKKKLWKNMSKEWTGWFSKWETYDL